MLCHIYNVSVTASQKKQAGSGKRGNLWMLEMPGSVPVHLLACARGLQQIVENVIFAPISLIFKRITDLLSVSCYFNTIHNDLDFKWKV